MKKLVSLTVALLTMTLLSSGVVSAAETQITDQAAAPPTASTTEQAPETTPAPTSATTIAPEQNNPHSLASRNAAATKLKAELDKHNAE
jgi:hypothetical protein